MEERFEKKTEDVYTKEATGPNLVLHYISLVESTFIDARVETKLAVTWVSSQLS